jgi:ribosomal protein L28
VKKMAKKVSTKKPLIINSRSKALNATKRAQKPNLQKKTINGVKVIISAREAKKETK